MLFLFFKRLFDEMRIFYASSIHYIFGGIMMKENINALDEIHKGACMGVDALSFVMDKVEDKKFKDEMQREYNDYKMIAQKIEDIYPKYNDDKPHETSGMNKVKTYTSIEMKTMNDKSNSKLAELLLNGVNMGIIEGRRILNKKEIDNEVNKIVSEYVTMQEENVENLKSYL